MATGTISPPSTFAATRTYLGFDYVFAEQEIQLEMQDMLDVSSLGVVALAGDLAGSGSDTVRVTDWGGAGFGLAMTALINENDTVAPSPYTLGYETVTLGQFGIGHKETYKDQILSTGRGISLTVLKSTVPASWMRTFRDRVCAVGATIATSVGSSSTTLSVDDHLDLVTQFRTQLGARRPVCMIDPTPLDQLLRSYRNEPAMQSSAADFSRLQGLQTDGDGKVSQIYTNLAGLGIDFAVTDSIVESGSAYQNFAFSAGGIGWARANTSPIVPANPQGAMYLPQYGLFIEELTSGAATTERQYRATAWIGFALGSTRVFKQKKLLSAV